MSIVHSLGNDVILSFSAVLVLFACAVSSDENADKKLTGILDTTSSASQHFRTKNKGIDIDDYGELLNSSVSQEVNGYGNKLIVLIKNLPCTTNCSDFDPKWGKTRNNISHYLVTFDDIDEVKGVMNNEKNFMDVVQILISYSVDHPEKLDVDLIKQATLLATESRPEMINVDILKVFPELMSEALAKPEGEDYQAGAVRRGNPTPVREPEDQMDYFREENALHYFHNAWHRDSSSRNPLNRHQNRFYNTHRQLLLRYQIERYVLGLPELVPMDANARGASFSSFYSLENHDNWANQFTSSKETCLINENIRSEMDRFHADLQSFAGSEPKSLEDYVEQLQNGYHNVGHVKLSEACSGNGQAKSHILYTSTASARDPVFYRWHLEVENIIAAFLNTKQPYSAEDLAPAQGITITSVEVHDKCGKTNQLLTFWESYNSEGKDFYRVNHDEFSTVVRLKNGGQSRDRVIVRIFLGVEEFISSGKWIIEMDKFIHQLSGNAEETITRSEKQSAYTKKTDDAAECGWPQHMFIPRGSDSQSTKFRIIVMIHGVQDQRTNEGLTTELSNVMCGTKDFNIVVDAREYSFPFNRKWSGLNYADVLNNRNSDFGQISSPIEIHFVGGNHEKKVCQASPASNTNSNNMASNNSNNMASGNGNTLGAEECLQAKCYRLSLSAVSWQDADNLCRDNGMALTSTVPAELANKHRSQNRKDIFWTLHQKGDKCYLTEGHKWYLHACSSSSQSGYNFLALCQKAVQRNRRKRHRRFRRQKL